MKLEICPDSIAEISEMLSAVKTSITHVMILEETAHSSKTILQDCVSAIEKILVLLKKDASPTQKMLKPLHAGLSRSLETLNVNVVNRSLSASRSTSDLGEHLYDKNSEDDQINNLNNLKESYLQVVHDLNNINEINGDKPTNVNQSKPDASITKRELNEDKPVMNNSQSGISDAKPESKQVKPAMNEDTPVMRRENGGKSEAEKRRRKRDSSTLFDISLDDLTEPDHSGILQEKHSGKEWWCVLQDQHLCMFPSQNPEELAYDVLLVPCCEISLDDVYTESPVFRLTQVGSTPWVFSAGIERNLRAWIRALYRASGREDVDACMRSAGSRPKRRSDKKQKKRDMKVFSSTIEETEEDDEKEEELEGKVDGISGEIHEETKEDEVEERVDGMTGEIHEETKEEEVERKVDEISGEIHEETKEEEVAGKVDGISGEIHGETKEGEVERKVDEISGEIHEETKEEEVAGKVDGITGEIHEEIKEEEVEEEVDGMSGEIHEKTKEGEVEGKVDGMSGEIHGETKEEQTAKAEQGEVVTSKEKEKGAEIEVGELVQETKGNEEKQKYREIKELKRQKELRQGEAEESVRSDNEKEEDKPVSNQEIFQNVSQNEKRSSTERNLRNVAPDHVTCDDVKHDDVVTTPDDSTKEDFINMTLTRRQTKRSAQILRWVKKVFLGDDGQNVSVVGDICIKVEGAKNKPKKLWCLLRNRQLYCYHDFKTSTAEMVIPLDSCNVVREVNTGGPFTFSIEKDNTKLCTVFAKTATEREKLMEVFRTKRGTILLREFYEIEGDEDSDNDEEGEFDETSYEDMEGYLCNNRGGVDRERYDDEKIYDVPLEDNGPVACDGCDNEAYISVLELENEIKRQRSLKKNIPNIFCTPDQNKLTESGKHPETSLLYTPLMTMEVIPVNRRDRPMPLPKPTMAGDKKTITSPEATEGKQPLYQEVSHYHNDGHDETVLEQSTNTTDAPLDVCHVTATTSLKDSPAEQGLLGQRSSPGMTGCWRPEINDKKQFLELDLGEVTNIGAIAIEGRPDYDAHGGEFVKSFSLLYWNTKEKWTAYKKKAFHGNSTAHEECKKILKHTITARYIRICPESWHNRIALRVALYKEQGHTKKVKVNGKHNGKVSSPIGNPPGRKDKAINKTLHISSPMSTTEPLGQFDFEVKKDTCPTKLPGAPTNLPNETNGGLSFGAQSMGSRIKLRENLLIKEKKDQTAALEGLKKLMNYAKDKMIVVSSSTPTKSEAVESEEEYLTINLEMVKVKRRLLEVETELRELRLFASRHEEEREQLEREQILPKSRKAVVKRRPSKEIKVCTDAISPVVDRKSFNPDGEKPPPKKVLCNVKIFESLHNK